MSAGTSSGLLDKVRAQSVFKHQILDSYITPFVRMTGSGPQEGLAPGQLNRVVLLDGFAGRGRYPDGKPASAEQLLLAAQKAKNRVAVEVILVERNRLLYENLKSVTDEYRSREVVAEALHGSVEDYLDEVLTRAPAAPLFLFLDPCGRNLPFDVLAGALNVRRSNWPPTEALLNISADLTRRAAGIARKEERNGYVVLEHVDAMCGGGWWREIAVRARENSIEDSWESAAEAVVQEYARRLGAATGMHPVVVPVRRQQHHQPVYHLVYLTRSPYGLWVFGDAVATARQRWLEVLGPDESEQGTLFELDSVKLQIESESEAALVAIERNILDLVSHSRRSRLVDHTMDIFGVNHGVAQEKLVRKAIRNLQRQGSIELLKSGNRLRDWVIGPISL